MLLPNWENRDTITRDWLNPAICSLVIHECALSYYQNHRKEHYLPYSLSILVIPLVLIPSIRKRLPLNEKIGVNKWLKQNTEIANNLLLQIKYCLPYSQEAIAFMLHHELANITDEGNIDPIICNVKKIKNKDTELNKILTHAEFVGRWFADKNTDTIIYKHLSIQP
jgi:hypothetical protein